MIEIEEIHTTKEENLCNIISGETVKIMKSIISNEFHSADVKKKREKKIVLYGKEIKRRQIIEVVLIFIKTN